MRVRAPRAQRGPQDLQRLIRQPPQWSSLTHCPPTPAGRSALLLHPKYCGTTWCQRPMAGAKGDSCWLQSRQKEPWMVVSKEPTLATPSAASRAGSCPVDFMASAWIVASLSSSCIYPVCLFRCHTSPALAFGIRKGPTKGTMWQTLRTWQEDQHSNRMHACIDVAKTQVHDGMQLWGVYIKDVLSSAYSDSFKKVRGGIATHLLHERPQRDAKAAVRLQIRPRRQCQPAAAQLHTHREQRAAAAQQRQHGRRRLRLGGA